MGAVQMRCVHGRVDYGYFPAATLAGFVVIRSGRGDWSLHGRAVSWDAFTMTRRPLVLVVPHVNQRTQQRGEWRWPVADIRITPGGETTARLGPPLE